MMNIKKMATTVHPVTLQPGRVNPTEFFSGEDPVIKLVTFGSAQQKDPFKNGFLPKRDNAMA
jgi:hypothetical protein